MVTLYAQLYLKMNLHISLICKHNLTNRCKRYINILLCSNVKCVFPMWIIILKVHIVEKAAQDILFTCPLEIPISVGINSKTAVSLFGSCFPPKAVLKTYLLYVLCVYLDLSFLLYICYYC